MTFAISGRRYGGAAVLVFAWLTAAASAQQTAPVPDWQHYHNERYGFHLDYPAGLFRPGPSPENADGLEFKTSDGKASIRAYGRFNVSQQTLQHLRAEELQERKGAVLTTDHAAGNSLVLSGFQQDVVFYLRVTLSNRSEVVNTLEIRYPRELKTQLDVLVGTMSRSFRPGRSSWYPHCCL